MSSKQVTVKFELQSNTFNKELKKTNNEIALTKQELKTAESSMKTYGANLTDLGKKQELYTKQIEQTEKKQKMYIDKVAELSKTYEKNKTDLQALGIEKEKLQKAYNESVKVIGKEADKTKELKQELDLVNLKYKDKKQSIDNTVNSIDKYGLEIERCNTSLTSLKGELDNTNKAIKENELGFKEASENMQKSSDKMKKIGSNISNVGDKIIGLSSALLAGAGGMAVFAGTFEEKIAFINTLLNNDVNLDGYKEKIIELSNETGISLNGIADGMYQAISSLGDLGMTTEEIFEVMAKSAKGGGADVADSVSLISSGMKGYGDVSEETAQKISDLAFQTAKLGC